MENLLKFEFANSKSEFLIIEDLANVIWKEHYTPIIGIEQVEYMLRKYQSVEAIESQTKENSEYYIINYQNTAVGYLSFYPKENSLFLSKIYLLNNFRGLKIGKKAMLFVEEKAKKQGLKTISLMVNKYNFASIQAYEKMNFVKTIDLIVDIGNGYIMDDFMMEKNILVSNG